MCDVAYTLGRTSCCEEYRATGASVDKSSELIPCEMCIDLARKNRQDSLCRGVCVCVCACVC